MITAEEFFRNKLKELQPFKEVITLSNEMITAEQGMRWAHEFKQLNKPVVVRGLLPKCPHCQGTGIDPMIPNYNEPLNSKPEPLPAEGSAKSVRVGECDHDPIEDKLGFYYCSKCRTLL